MKNEQLPIIYEDENLLVVDKPAGINSDNFPLRIHRLDKDTSGILLIAKNEKSLKFFQKQFQERKVRKKYILLAVGRMKRKKGEIKSFFARGGKDRRKQKIFSPLEPDAKKKNLKLAVTEYKVIKEFSEYTLIEALLKTGRKHQIRAHFASLGHPLVGDKLYGFKNSPCPKELKRQFLHAFYLKIKLPSGKEKEFNSKLPKELENILNKLKARNLKNHV